MIFCRNAYRFLRKKSVNVRQKSLYHSKKVYGVRATLKKKSASTQSWLCCLVTWWSMLWFMNCAIWLNSIILKNSGRTWICFVILKNAERILNSITIWYLCFDVRRELCPKLCRKRAISMEQIENIFIRKRIVLRINMPKIREPNAYFAIIVILCQ